MSTRAQLRTYARARADQTDSEFPSDAEYNVWLDDGAREVWYDLVQAGWPVNYTAVNKTAAGTNPITLGVSGTIAFIRGVYYKQGTTYTELRRITEGDRASLLSVTGTTAASHYEMRIDATNGPVLELLPLPSSGTYRVEYILEHPGFSGDSVSWYGPGRSDELLVLKAAAKGCRKEGNDQGAKQLSDEYVYLLSKVQAMASWFDQRNAATIRDVGMEAQLGGGRRDPFDYDV